MGREIIFHKYQGAEREYLVYDINKNENTWDCDMIRCIRNRNFGVYLDGILVGPYMENGIYAATVYDPDSGKIIKKEESDLILSRYLQDAGYVKKENNEEENALHQSKIYCWC